MTTNDILHKEESIMTTPTMEDTRTAVLIQLIEVYDKESLIIGATLGTTIFMLANNINAGNVDRDIGYLYG